MTRGIQPIRREIPDWASVYVFGSALRSANPSDLDLLVIYEPRLCPPKQARDTAETLVAELTRDMGLQPHVVVLTKTEEQDVGFIQNEGCLEFADWLNARQSRSVAL